MKQNIILEPADLDRLKAGEALQLTGNLLLSLQATKRYKPRVDRATNPDEGLTPEDVRKEAKRRYQAQYRRKQKAKQRHQPGPYHCQGCGKGFASPNALGPHKRHCPGRPS